MDTTRIVPPAERRRLLLQVYYTLDKREKNAIDDRDKSSIGYSEFHRIVRDLQGKLETEHKLTLGYAFKGENFFGPWDDELQQDLEMLDMHHLVDNHDEPFDHGRKVYKHDLHPRDAGRQVAELYEKYQGGQLLGRSRQAIKHTIEEVISSQSSSSP